MAFLAPQPLSLRPPSGRLKSSIPRCTLSEPSTHKTPSKKSSSPSLKPNIAPTSLESKTKAKWSRDSWRTFPILQQPTYPDPSALRQVETQLSQAPPLVFPGEIHRLRSELAKASRGESFVLQGGDCAESFDDFSSGGIERMFRVLVGGVVIISYLSGLNVVKIGRIAGQFAKPRSANMEKLGNGEEIEVFRGDIINSVEGTKEARVPDPKRLIRAYSQSASALNMLRALAKGGESMDDWMEVLETVDKGVRGDFVERVDDALGFIKACGVDVGGGVLREPEFYTSHEALLLPYEAPLTRAGKDGKTGEVLWYDTSAHMLWCGERTRQLDGAHVEFLRGLENPIGCKLGPGMEPDELVRIVKALNPKNEEGKLMLIVRMGAERVYRKLPLLLKAIRREGLNVVWSCDPMHENTIKTDSGRKTRPFDLIKAEMDAFFAVHAAEGTIPGGIHLEMTGDDVTECLGGKTAAITEERLGENFRSTCDPRLNCSQALEMAFAVGERLRHRRKARARRSGHAFLQN